MGDGPGLSSLIWDSGDGLRYTATSNDNCILHASDLAFCTKGAGGTALKADYSAQIDKANGHSMGRDKPRFLVQNCVFQYGSGLFDSGWDVCLDVIAGLIGVVRDCSFAGRIDRAINGWPVPTEATIGCWFHGVGDEGQYNGRPVQFVVDGSSFYHQDVSIKCDGCEGVFVTNSNLVGVGNGVVWNSHWEQRPQLNVNNCHINAYKAGIVAYDCADLQLSHNLIYNFVTGYEHSIGIYCGGSLGCPTATIIGNTFCGTTQLMNGVVVGKGNDGVIAHNVFRGQIATAVWLQADTQRFRGQDNLLATMPEFYGLYDQGQGNAVSVPAQV